MPSFAAPRRDGPGGGAREGIALQRMGYTEAARVAGLSPRTIRSAAAAGELVARRCGRRVLISEADLEAWLDGMPQVAGDAA